MPMQHERHPDGHGMIYLEAAASNKTMETTIIISRFAISSSLECFNFEGLVGWLVGWLAGWLEAGGEGVRDAF